MRFLGETRYYCVPELQKRPDCADRSVLIFSGRFFFLVGANFFWLVLIFLVGANFFWLVLIFLVGANFFLLGANVWEKHANIYATMSIWLMADWCFGWRISLFQWHTWCL